MSATTSYRIPLSHDAELVVWFLERGQVTSFGRELEALDGELLGY